jgi:hypothetical protein
MRPADAAKDVLNSNYVHSVLRAREIAAVMGKVA